MSLMLKDLTISKQTQSLKTLMTLTLVGFEILPLPHSVDIWTLVQTVDGLSLRDDRRRCWGYELLQLLLLLLQHGQLLLKQLAAISVVIYSCSEN